MVLFVFGMLLTFGSRHGTQEAVDFYPGRCPALDARQIADGWLSLFDGQSLYGWRREANANWSVHEHTIHVSSGAIGLIRTAVQFDDFELQLEFKAHPDTNSGVFLRSSPKPKTPIGGCIEINIAPITDPFPTGSIVGYRKSNSVKLNSGFNTMQIRAVGNQVAVEINGKRVCEMANSQIPRKGYIGLQHNTGAVQFRNIVVRPLELESMFDGSTLDGWNTDNQRESDFQASKGVLDMRGGKGQLESIHRYADFVFFSHIRTNAVGLNSGIFFRCMPGEWMNGYESQIQNQFESADRTKPKDYGTGGIFRRLPARIVNASDEKWLAKTIIADGATLCVWVNGLLVSDWTDTRPPNANPRQGRRLESGTIILQGHDPATDMSFKEMRIRELRPRR